MGMRDLEFRNIGESRQAPWSLSPLALGLILLAVALLAIVVASGSVGEVDVSIPTRLFPGQ